MNIAIIGAGKISETIHLPILRSIPDLKIVALCDENQKRLSRVADFFNIEKRYSDVDDMIASVDLDIVDIATPGYTHFEIAKKLILTNINLLIEKPATIRTAESQYLEAESKKRNLKIGVFQTYRYRQPIIQFRKHVEEGRIGTIDRIVTLQRGGTIFAFPRWFWDERVSGGILFELGAHAIDLQCYIMGPAKEVLSVEINYDKTIDFTTSILAIIKFEHGIGVLDLKYFSSSNIFHQYICGSVSDAIIKFFPDYFVLKRGSSILPETFGELKRAWDFGRAAFRKKLFEEELILHRKILEDFIRVINTDNQPLVSMSGVIPTIRVMENIQSKAELLRKNF